MQVLDTGAETVHWNLTDLFPSLESLDAALDRAAKAAEDFDDAYRGRVKTLSASEMAAALSAIEEIYDDAGRAITYAYLNWVTATGDAERGALLQRVRESYNRISQRLIFLEVEWSKVEDETAQALIADEALAGYRHYLELERVRKDHLLTEPEEKVLSETSITGRLAWNRFFDETISSMRFELDGEVLPEQEVLAKLHEADRDLRRRAAMSFTEGLSDHSRTLTYIFNTLLAEKASTDRMRRYRNWLSSRNLSNEVDDATVDTLVSSVTSRYDLVARFYNLKKRLLGYDAFYDYDRYAPVGEATTRYPWHDAREIVTASYEAFHPTMGDIVARFFDGQWIDAAVTPGKRGGAFSHGVVPSAHPYIMMNYTGKIRDVQTLAHELGHGVHQYLSRDQGLLHSDTPLTTAETASVFGEMLVFQRLLRAESDDRNRLAMLVGKIDDTMATVFRQITMNRFENRVHTARRESGELTAEAFGDHWLETQDAMFGGSVTLTDEYRYWWSYIPHFLHTPGYVYAYAFGELLVLALHARYEEEGPGFGEKYLQLLKAGGSDWPHVLVARLGIDLQDSEFWARGLAAIEALIEQAEALAERTGV